MRTPEATRKTEAGGPAMNGRGRGLDSATGARGYGVAMLAVAAAFALRLGFDTLWGDRLAYAWFLLAVLATLRWAGLGPQLFSIGAGVLIGDWFFVQPRFSLLIERPLDQVNTVVFTGVCLVLVFIASRTRSSARRESAARDRLVGILECTSDAVCTLDSRWNITYFNERASAMARVQGAQVVGRHFWDLWPDFRDSRFHQEYRRVLEQKTAVHFEACHPKNEEIWIEVHACPYGDGLAIFFRDISNRKRSEASRARLAAIVESSDDAIIGATADGTILSWNAAAEGLYGYGPAAAVGRSLTTLFPTGRAEEIAPLLQQVRAGQRIAHFETQQQRQDGTITEVSLTISPVQTADGAIIGLSVTARDVSDRKRQEAERERLIGELRAALAEIKTLSGLLPICAHCKNIRDDKGSWTRIETYIRDRSDATFTHGICPECTDRLYPEFT